MLAEFCGILQIIEIAKEKNWLLLWIETDFILVVQPFSKPNLVPWQLRNRWTSYLLTSANMNFYISHTYREENSYAIFFANIGLTTNSLVIFYFLHLDIRNHLTYI